MNEHILIVEDEEKLARFVELELLHEGYQVSKSSNGREALAMAVAGDFRPYPSGYHASRPERSGGFKAASAGPSYACDLTHCPRRSHGQGSRA